MGSQVNKLRVMLGGEISGDDLEGTRLEARQGVSSVISSQEREFGTEITTLLSCKPDLGSLCL